MAVARSPCEAAVVSASGDKMTDGEARELIRYMEALLKAEQAAGHVDALDARMRQLAAEQAERAQIAAALARKHAALSAIAYSRGLAELKALVASGLDYRRAVLAFLEGSPRNVEGARDSVARLALAYRNRFLAPINEALVRDAEIRRAVEAGDRAFADAVVREMREAREGGRPGITGNGKARELAQIYAQVAEAARTDLNRLGFPIGRLDGWSPQAHASDRVVKVSPEEWAAYILPRLDRERSFPGLPDELVKTTLRDIYDSIVTGTNRNGSVAGETGRLGPANLATSLARARVLHFRDADAWLSYAQRFGNGHIHDAMLAHLGAAAKAAAQVQKLGPNPEQTLTRWRAELQRTASTDPRLTPQQRQRAAAALDPRNVQGSIGSAWAEVSGLTAVPVSVRAANIGTALRAWQSLSKLMGAVLSSIPGDLPVRGAALTVQGQPLLASVRNNLVELVRGRGGTADQRRIAAQLNAGIDGMLGHITHALVAEDVPLGRWHRAMATGFRLSGMTWWQDAMKAGAARMLSRWMADNAATGWDGLGARYRAVLRQQGIGAAEWDAIRATAWQADDGESYITPDRLAAVPRPVLARLAQARLEAMQAGMSARVAGREARNAAEAEWVAKRTARFQASLARTREAWTKRSRARAEGGAREADRIGAAISDLELRLSELGEFRAALAEGRAWSEAAAEAPPAPLTREEWAARGGELGQHGPIFRDVQGQDAIARLMEARDGEAPAALQHPEIGVIDLLYGEAPAAGKEGFGLAKIAAKHPEMMEGLPERLAGMQIIGRGPNRIRLADDTARAVVRLDLDGKEKVWLLTAYEPRRDALRAADDGQAAPRGRADTAPPDAQGKGDVGAEGRHGNRPGESKSLSYLDDGSPATLAARAEGEARARIARLRRAIGEVRRAAKGRDVADAEAFEAHWIARERELMAFADQMADRAQRRQQATEAERAEWGDRVEAALQDARRELELKLHGFFADEMGSAVIESDAQTRRMLLRGARPGSITGELLRAVAQFKAFPVAFTNRVLARQAMAYGPGERMLQGRNIGVLIAGLVVAGYISGALKDMVRGYEPADPAEPKAWLRALLQSGGAGIYGDFLFGQANRFGNGALETVAGPLLGTGASAVNLATKLRDGDARAGEVLNLALQNSPFINLWYARPVLDFLILNALREALSPGFLRRQAEQRRKDFGQDRVAPPALFQF